MFANGLRVGRPVTWLLDTGGFNPLREVFGGDKAGVMVCGLSSGIANI